MNSKIEAAAATYVAPKLMRNFKLRWLLYGAAAYYGLRLMSKRGIFPTQADAALDVIDRGIGAVKQRVGMSGGSRTSDITSGIDDQVGLSH